MTNDVFIQVGVTALRSPKGDILPAVPLYIKANQLKQSGLTQAEENILHDISGIFAEKHEQCRRENKKTKNKTTAKQ